MPVTIDPRRHDAVLFDLDGVITDTASVHAQTWTELFNEYLRGRPNQSPFTHSDYLRFVDGKPRYDGVRDFLASRGISLPWGTPEDTGADTVCGLGNRKQTLFAQRLARGVPAFDSTVEFVRQLHQIGVRTAVFSSSRNCAAVLAAAGVAELFAVRVDGVVAAELGLPGKPDPATLVEAADRLGVRPNRSVVVEDAESGVAAGRSGGFALVIGIDRTDPGSGHTENLRRSGADVVVADLSEVSVRTGDAPMSALPDAVAALDSGTQLAITGPTAVFFDFDGTLSEIVNDPGAATLVAGAADALRELSGRCAVAVLSGRDLSDVRHRIGLPGIWYAGSHGFELTGPDGSHHQNDAAAKAVPVLAAAAAELRARFDAVHGVLVEHKRFAVAVHYRNAAREQIGAVAAAVHGAGQSHRLRVTTGREVIELRPDIDWDKGKTLRWVLDRLAAEHSSAAASGRLLPIYLGDDITDEDAFDAVHDPDVNGIGIVVRHSEDGDRATAARFAVGSPAGVVEFVRQLARHIG